MEATGSSSDLPKPIIRKSPRLIDKENRQNTPKSLICKPAVLNKKRVSFGDALSPEYFDKRLPPITPVRFGQSPMGTPKEKDRRKSEPLRQALLSASGKKLSNGTTLATIPIAEEDDMQYAPPLLDLDLSNSVHDVFEDSPTTKLNLPSPLKAEVVSSFSDNTALIEEKNRLFTPITNQIGLDLQINDKMHAPQESVNKHKQILRPKYKKLLTPLRKEIEQRKFSRQLKKSVRTPLKSPLKRDIIAKPMLRKSLNTLRRIKKGNPI